MLLATTLNVGAQEEDEYQMELGVAAGTSFYLGDANKVPFRHMNGMHH